VRVIDTTVAAPVRRSRDPRVNAEDTGDCADRPVLFIRALNVGGAQLS
jgi:hypothetical protein